MLDPALKHLSEAMESGDSSLIGQFGVGFYSAYLVADRVQVISKHNDDSVYCWESNAEGSFTVSSVENELSRGTEIVLHMKDDQTEYLEESKLREIITRHSEFINYPILLLCQKEREVKEEVDEDNEDETNEGEVTEVDESSNQNQEMESVRKEIFSEFEELNKNKPIWTRNPKDITTEEYNSFYKSFTRDWDDCLTHKHFSEKGKWNLDLYYFYLKDLHLICLKILIRKERMLNYMSEEFLLQMNVMN